MTEPMKPQSGVTLVELLIVIVVMAILTALAVPSFRTMVINNQVRSFTNNLYASLLLARSEAIKRNTNVTVCASSNGTSCTGSWSAGWITVAGTPSAVGSIVQKQGTQKGTFSLSGPIGVYYNSQSAAATCTSTSSCASPVSVYLSICPASASTATPCQCISIAPFGTPTINKSANGTSCP